MFPLLDRRRFVVAAAAASLLVGWGAPARAQEPFPSRPIKILVGAGAGGSTDITARLVSQHLSRLLGQPVIVENRPGAAGTLSMQQMVRAPADGYTLNWVGNSVMTVAPHLYKNPGYDARSVIPVSLGTTSSFVLLAAPNLGIDDVAALVAHARANPGRLSFGSNGINGALHLLAELMKLEAGFDALHVPYKGGAESANATMSGSIQFFFDALSSNLSLIESGKLKALAITGPRREKSLPQVPTMAEVGYPGMTTQVFFGLVAPPGTPDAVVAKLADAMRTSLADPVLREALAKTGNEATSSTPAQFRALIDKESERFKALLKAKGIQPE